MSTPPSLSIALALALTTPLASARPNPEPLLPTGPQGGQPLVQEGDNIPGVGNVTTISNFAINAAGDWLVEADTDNPDTDADSVLLQNGTLVLREGDALGSPAGALLDSIDSVTLNAQGQSGFNHFLDGPGSGFDSGIYLDTTLLIQEGDIVGAPSVTPGTPYIGFFDVKINDSDQLLVMASTDDVNVPSSVDRLLAVLDVTGGALQSTTAILAEGDPAPGTTELVEDFGTGPHESAFNNAGDVLFTAELSGLAAEDVAVYLGSTLLAREGAVSPVAGRTWASLGSTKVDLNEAGDYVFSGRLDGDTASDSLIVKNGAKFRQEGDSLGAIAPFLFTSFGTGPIRIANSGDVLWYGDWDDPDTDVDTGLFLNDTLLVQEGVTSIGGVLVDTLRGVTDGFTLSDDGSRAVFEAVLANGVEGAFLIEFELGTNYCLSLPNSTGSPASISGLGSTSVGSNAFSLSAAPLPQNVFGIFYYGSAQIAVAFGDGFRCVGSGMTGVFRLPIQNAGAGGILSYSFDLTNPPSAAGTIIPGSTWNFQAWFRDQAAGGAGFNLSDGLEVVFTP